MTEFVNTINKYSSSFTLDPDHISWSHLKALLDNDKYIANIVNIANSYINFGYQSSHFKKLTSIIISKSNKTLYDNPKTF